jgi:hypothetical protein
MPFNRKALLSLLGVFRQRAVRESNASDGTLFIDHIDNLAEVKNPKCLITMATVSPV